MDTTKRESVINETEPIFLTCEKDFVFRLLIFVAGAFGAFTYVCRGGVFCNAQTANLLMMSANFGQGNFAKACYYLIPFVSYILGTIVSELLPNTFKRRLKIRWDTSLIFFEIIIVIILGFISNTVPVQISQIIVNFTCSMQYNTFRQAKGIPMATTFCTNHVRQLGVGIAKIMSGKSNEATNTRMKSHMIMLICFVLGVLIEAFLGKKIGAKSIWFVSIPLIIAFIKLLYADKVEEKEFIEKKPRGH